MDIIETHLNNLCKAKAIMSFMSCCDPIVDESKSALENWALAYDVLINATFHAELDLAQIDEEWQNKTGCEFIVWEKFYDESSPKIAELIEEEYNCQLITVMQVREILDGKSLSEV